MDQYINATHLLDNIDKAINRTMARGSAKYEYDELTRATLGVLKQMVRMEVKQGEVRPVVHAHWVERYGWWHCSECFTRSYDRENGQWFNGKKPMLCPYCGALMDEPDQED